MILSVHFFDFFLGVFVTFDVLVETPKSKWSGGWPYGPLVMAKFGLGPINTRRDPSFSVLDRDDLRVIRGRLGHDPLVIKT